MDFIHAGSEVFFNEDRKKSITIIILFYLFIKYIINLNYLFNPAWRYKFATNGQNFDVKLRKDKEKNPMNATSMSR